LRSFTILVIVLRLETVTLLARSAKEYSLTTSRLAPEVTNGEAAIDDRPQDDNRRQTINEMGSKVARRTLT